MPPSCRRDRPIDQNDRLRTERFWQWPIQSRRIFQDHEIRVERGNLGRGQFGEAASAAWRHIAPARNLDCLAKQAARPNAKETLRAPREIDGDAGLFG